MDPLDPLLQQLVQDKLFAAAVKTGQLHAAAAAAIKILRMSTAGEQKRCSDKRFGSREMGGVYANGVVPRPSAPAYSIVPGVRSMKQEVLQLEDGIPWPMVRRTWRNKRASWRRQVKATELVADLALRLKELRLALLTEDGNFVGCGIGWRNQLESCINGRGSAAALISVWDEMKNTIRSWLGAPSATPGAGFGAPNGPAPSNISTVFAVQALQAAVQAGGEEALLQTPLESIVGNDSCSLHAVRQAVELERRVLMARLAALQGNGSPGEGAQRAVVSYFTSINASWEESEFDSGAESEMGEGSDVTDLDSDFDA